MVPCRVKESVNRALVLETGQMFSDYLMSCGYDILYYHHRSMSRAISRPTAQLLKQGYFALMAVEAPNLSCT